jgi:hypothetical protein
MMETLDSRHSPSQRNLIMAACRRKKVRAQALPRHARTLFREDLAETYFPPVVVVVVSVLSVCTTGAAGTTTAG